MTSDSPFPSISDRYGGLLITTIVCSVLYGASLIQFFNYCERFWKSDRLSLKCAVTAAMIVETAHLLVIIKATYDYVIVDFDAPVKLIFLDQSLLTLAPLSATTIGIAQGLLISKVYRMSERNKTWLSALVFLGFAELAVIIAYFVILSHDIFIPQVERGRTVAVEMALNIVFLIADTALAGSLVFFLYRQRSGVRRTDSVVRLIVIYTISSTAITIFISFFALMDAIFVKNNYIYILADITIGKCYVNCMFVSLNARSGLQERLESTFRLSSIQFSSTSTEGNQSSDAAEGQAYV